MKTIFSKVKELEETVFSLKEKVGKLQDRIIKVELSKFQYQHEDSNLRFKCLEMTEKKYGQLNPKEAEKLYDYISKGKVTE